MLLPRLENKQNAVQESYLPTSEKNLQPSTIPEKLAAIPGACRVELNTPMRDMNTSLSTVYPVFPTPPPAFIRLKMFTPPNQPPQTYSILYPCY